MAIDKAVIEVDTQASPRLRKLLRGSPAEPFLAIKKWSHRSGFLHPAVAISDEVTSTKYYRVFPRSLLRMNTLPAALSQFGLLIPSILHNIEIQLLIRELSATVLSEIKNPHSELTGIAISASAARGQENYRTLEFLGGSVFEYFIQVFAAAKCMFRASPDTDEVKDDMLRSTLA